ncbi:Dynein-1-beta heavy chain, flagellar inner arm I1 complex [Larimichthys crocea]|uniref:Uncharacterized protein n=1 Tax=Larimichthys crocea TaxID=215358 RepID=A0ACD3Q4C3_LARCR|nr:Dynein-1-beta heavy chain, flagellar inner arm I1 complex [Larimichthys crocea]
MTVSLCYVLSILLEKKTFLKLGRNIVSESLLRLYLDEYEKLPWDALKYLIAGANYGGHVTDDLTFFNPRAYLARARARLYPLCAVTWATKRFHGDMHTCSASGLTEATHEPKTSLTMGKEEDFEEEALKEMEEEYSKTIRRLFIRCVALPGVTEELWTEENNSAVDQFIVNDSITAMVVYVDAYARLRVEYSMPLPVVEQLFFFIRVPGSIITAETFDVVIQFGTVRGDPAKRLLHDMTCVHAHAVALSAHGEKSIKDNYTNHMHCYLASLTDDVYKKVGKTVLYIPLEGLQSSPEEAIKNKKLVQRMETVMIHWTDQIKELLNDQEIMNTRDKCGPLQEIELWKSRSVKLVDISKQLQKPGVKHIQNILELSKSLYVQRFCKLAKEIQDCSLEAQSNLTYLSMLKGPCEELAQLKPSQVAPKLQHIVSLIRIIWVNSTHYNTSERIAGLFRKISNEIIRLCFQSISLDRIFEGYVLSSKQNLSDCIQCCLSWKEIYQHASQLHHKYSSKGWVLDQTSFFVVIDAFIQRFRDLLEVCDCQYQFARWEDGQQRALPCFSSCQGPEFTRSLLEIEGNFHRGLQKLGSVDKGILDVESTTWCNEFNRFRALIKDLEMMVQNLISSVFKTVYTVEEGVRLLDIFRPISTREAVKLTTDEKVEEVYNIFNKELKLVKKELNQKSRSFPDHMPRIAGQAHWVTALRHRLERPMEIAFMDSSEPSFLDFLSFVFFPSHPGASKGPLHA